MIKKTNGFSKLAPLCFSDDLPLTVFAISLLTRNGLYPLLVWHIPLWCGFGIVGVTLVAMIFI